MKTEDEDSATTTEENSVKTAENDSEEDTANAEDKLKKATPSNAEADDEDDEDEYEEDVDLIDDRVEKPSFATSSDAEEEDEELEEEVELATASNAAALEADAEEIELTFNANGGTFESGEDEITETVTIPGKIDVPYVKTEEGYVVTGWYTKPVGGEKIIWGNWENMTWYLAPEDLGDVTTLYAHIEKEVTVQLTFDANGGKFESGESISVSEETIPTEIELPYVEHGAGYKLTGWYTEPVGGKLIYDGLSRYEEFTSEQLNETTTLYAQWKEDSSIQQIDLLFDANGGMFEAGGSSITKSVVVPGEVRFPIVKAREGYMMTGWYTEPVGGKQILWGNYGDREEITQERLQGATKLYVQWERTSLTLNLTFDANGGELSDGSTSKTYDEVHLPDIVEIPRVNERSDYTMLGWSTDPEGKNLIIPGSSWISYQITPGMLGDVTTLYACWKEKETVELTFDANGGKLADGSVSKTSTVKIPNIVDIPALEYRDGYNMTGWCSDPEGKNLILGMSIYGGSYHITPEQLNGTTTLYARWEEDKREIVNLKFEPNGGELAYGSKSETGPVRIPDSIQFPTLNYRAGYTMIGWSTDPEGNNLIISGNYGGWLYITPQMLNGTDTLYAQWKQVVNLTFDANGGELANGGTAIVINDVIIPSEIDIPTVAKRTGYKMIGWYTQAQEGKKIFASDSDKCYVTSELLNGVTTLYAHWAPESSVVLNLTFDANGGELENGGTSVEKEVIIPAEIQIPTVAKRAGYKMTGWFTAPVGGKKIFEGNSWWPYTTLEKLDGATTLYAQWEEATYTVTFKSGNKELKTVEVKEGDRVEEPGNLGLYDDLSPNYIKGWSTNYWTDTDLYDFSQPVTQNIILYAKVGQRTELKELYSVDIDISNAYYHYNGRPIENVIDKVTYMDLKDRWEKIELQEGVDYIIDSYENNIERGTATVTIRGINKYKGTLSENFRIIEGYLDDAKITFNDESNGRYEFTGKPIRPDITVQVEGTILREGVDYEVSWPRYIGSHFVSLHGIGNYTSYASVQMEIVGVNIPEARSVKENYSQAVYMHAGETKKLVEAEPESSVAGIGDNGLYTDFSLFSFDADGILHALKEGDTHVSPVLYWKDGKETFLNQFNLHVVPDSTKIVTIKLIAQDTTFYDGTTEMTYTIPNQESVTFKSLNEPEGKIFLGWYTEDGIKITNGNYISVADHDMTLYAKFAKKITVHFDFGEGEVQDSYKTREIAEGDSIWLSTGNSAPATREGYILAGWCLDPECKGEVLKDTYIPKLAENETEITLYAKWERSYQLTFDLGDGYFQYDSAEKTIAVQEGHSIGNAMPSDPLSTTGTFGGWYTEDGTRVTKSYIPTGDMKLYARWLKEKTHRVTFHANGDYFYGNEKADADDPTTATRQVQDGYPASISVSRSNYNCQWYKDSDFTIPYNMDAAVTEDLDLYARWVRRLQLNWDADGGVNTSGQSTGSTTFDEGAACSIPKVTKEGYRFDGWYTEDGQLITNQTHLNTSVSIKARWTLAQVHVTLDLDGGELSPYYNQTSLYVNPGDKLATVINGFPRKEGAAFLGWIAEDGTRYDGLYWITATGDQSEMKLTAQWTTDYVTVTFDAEDSSIYNEFTMEYNRQLSYRVPKNQKCPGWLYDPSPAEVGDRTVKGWNTAQGSTEVMDIEQMSFTEDTVFYPVWSAYWRISFDYMGGFYYTNSTSQMSRVIARGQELTYPGANQMTRPGYRFAGWYESPDYSGEKFDPPFIPERNMMLYAKWVNENAKIYKVTFDPQNEGGESFTREVSEGDRVAKPVDPEKTGFIFGGWYTDAACTTPYDFAAAVQGDLILYAKWTETKDVKDADITFARVVYNGEKQEPDVTVKIGDQVLRKGIDYTITYPDVPENTNAGTGYAVIEGIGDFEGTVNAKFTIEKAQYDVEPLISRVTAEYGQKLSDLDLSAAGEGWHWADAQQSVGDAGEHTFQIVYTLGDENYEDKEAQITVVVSAFALTNTNTALSLAEDQEIFYDGTEKKPQISVVLNGNALTEGEDYTVAYKDNVNAGTAAYVVTGINNYRGTLTGTFEILKAAASAADFGIANQIYEGVYDGKLSEVTPSLPEHWSWEDPDMVFDTVTGDATITLPANFTTYEGCNFASAENVPLRVRIAPRELNVSDVTLSKQNAYYTGEACKVEVSVTSNGKTLKENQDYKVTYQDNIEIGTASVIVEGTGNYTGKITKHFQIITDPYDIRGAEIQVNPMTSPYTGEEITPEVTVRMQNAETNKTDTLTQGTDYEVSFDNNINPGTATVTVTGKGRYHDTKIAKFYIEADEYRITATYGDKLSDVAGQLPAGWSWKEADAYVGDVTGTEGRSVEAVYTAHGEERTGSFLLIVEAKELRKEMVEINGTNISYHPEVELNKAKVVVTDPELEKVLIEDVDYTVTYSNYDKVSDDGVAVIIKGIGNYSGVISDKYILAKADPKVEFTSDKINADHVMKLTALDEPFFLYTTFAGNGTVTYESGNPSVFTVETKDNQIGNANDGYITVAGVGEANLTVTLSGDPNYEDQTIVIRVQVEAVALQDSNVVLEQDSYSYTGDQIEPKVTVSYAGKTLEADKDYAVAYENNTNAGEAQVTVTGIGSFSGTIVKTFVIEKAENPIQAPSKAFASVYGQTLGSIALPDGWTWDTPDAPVGNVGDHSYAITLAETENYVEKHAEAEVVVSAKDFTDDMVQLSADAFEYTGSAIEPEVTVSDGTLLQESDYIISYENNVEVGTNATVTVTAAEGGNYTGSVTKTFTITRAALIDEAVQITGSYTYDGTQQTPAVTVMLHERELSLGEDYEIAYGENIHAGTDAGSVTVRGIGHYEGEITKTFDIAKAENPAEIPELVFTAVYGQKLETLELPDGWFWRDSDGTVGDAGENQIEMYLPETEDYLEKAAYAKVSVARKEKQDDMLKADLSDITFTGNEVKPEISLTDGSYVLREGVDYTISYRNNLHAGTATMIITFIGNYSGTMEKEFTIEQSEAVITVGAGTTISHTMQSGAFDLNAVVSGNGELQYTSTNPEVATVDEDGIVTPVGVGTTVITVIFLGDRDYKPAAVSVTLTITQASTDHSSGNRSDSDDSRDSGSSSGNSTGSTGAAAQMITYHGVSIPSYVNVENQWKAMADGTWTLVDVNGEVIRDQWMAVYNPYADVVNGQEAYDWYRFDNDGKMITGWYVDEKGDTYYLNPSADNTQGGMETGWVEIDGKWYYFNNLSDGTRGKLLKNTTTPDGYHVQEDGSWDGVQKK